MRLVLMTSARQATTEVLPALGLLDHQVRVVAPELSSLLDGDSGDVVLVDARHDLIRARTLCGLLASTGVAAALVAVPATRRIGGWASAGVLAAVFPANVQMAYDVVSSPRTSPGFKAGTLLRLPLQVPLVLWGLQVAGKLSSTGRRA